MLFRKKSRKLQRVSIAPEEQNLHKSLRHVLTIAQVFGYFPVQGVLKKDVASLGFKWISLRVLSAFVTIFFGTLVTLIHLRLLILTGYDQFEMNAIIFHSCGTLSCICFLQMARKWQTIMLKWQEVDYSMASYGWPKTLNKRLKITSTIFLLLEAAEHFSIQANKLIVAVQCKGSLAEGFEHFSVNMSFSAVFDVIKPYYSAWIGILFQIINTRMAFAWTFIDLFIILIGCALALRFQQVNYRVRCMRDMKVRNERSWVAVKEDYNRLCQLCRFLDDKMSWIILVSFFNNFYFIIFQVFDSLNLYMATMLETVYYFVSLALLISRIVSVCLYASWIHEESKRTQDLLSGISHEVYNKEITKFIECVRYQSVGLTGKHFFRITKGLILQIAGAVVTYELVVVQFSYNNLSKRDSPSRNSKC